MKNLPMDLLRAFVTVVEFNSFTKAGDLLGRTQPAISLQINRLESMLDETLIIKDGKNLILSDVGELWVGGRVLRIGNPILQLRERQVAPIAQ